MLKHEEDRRYIVYPSWARLAYRWDELAQVLSHPLESGRFQPGFDPQAFGFPIVAQPFDLEDGPRGGGIVVVHAKRQDRWLAGLVLGRNANTRSPDAVLSMQAGSFASDVMYVEPYESAPQGAGVPTQRLYICGVSPEHLDSAGDSVYWVLGHSGARAEIPELKEVAAVGQGFGLEVMPAGPMPPELKAEAEPLFMNQPMHYLWFRITKGDSSAGHHFARLLYTALHLKEVIGRQMHVMHLCARIEGHPRARQFWASRVLGSRR